MEISRGNTFFVPIGFVAVSIISPLIIIKKAIYFSVCESETEKYIAFLKQSQNIILEKYLSSDEEKIFKILIRFCVYPSSFEENDT